MPVKTIKMPYTTVSMACVNFQKTQNLVKPQVIFKTITRVQLPRRVLPREKKQRGQTLSPVLRDWSFGTVTLIGRYSYAMFKSKTEVIRCFVKLYQCKRDDQVIPDTVFKNAP